ncbi:MAG: hypothetical protein DHS20C06_15970 [Hyphobacterium sp.]|nr:MAG: hypothetical protein DHS20C06_15970 [Hyphobacterium sp.]
MVDRAVMNFILLMASLLADGGQTTDRPTSEWISCTPLTAVHAWPTDEDAVPHLGRYAFSLTWVTLADAQRRAGHPESVGAPAGDIPAYVVDGEADVFARMVNVSVRDPGIWAVRRATNHNSAQHFSIVSHDYQTGAALTIYPDEEKFLLYVPLAQLDADDINALIVRGVCDVAWPTSIDQDDD